MFSEIKSKRRKYFDDKLSHGLLRKLNSSQLQEEKFRAKVATKEVILKLKVEREKQITELLKAEIKLRMKCTLAKHKADIELIDLQKKQFIDDL